MKNKEETGHFSFFFFETYFNRFFENIKNHLKHSLVPWETVRQFGRHRRILNLQTELRYISLKVCCPFTTERAYQGFITYFDFIETQIKTMMAKQLNCSEKGRKASRLKRLRNRDEQKSVL